METEPNQKIIGPYIFDEANIKGLSEYVLGNPNYEPGLIELGLRSPESRSFLAQLLKGIKKGILRPGEKHRDRVVDDLFGFYEHDADEAKLIDRVLARDNYKFMQPPSREECERVYAQEARTSRKAFLAHFRDVIKSLGRPCRP